MWTIPYKDEGRVAHTIDGPISVSNVHYGHWRNAMSNTGKPHDKTPNNKKLRRLEHTCEMTSNRYLEILGKTCEKMTTFDLAPVSLDERLQLVLWRQKEELAHRAYVDARSQLMDYLTGVSVI